MYRLNARDGILEKITSINLMVNILGAWSLTGSQMFSSAMRLYSSEILLRDTIVSICKTQTSVSYNQKVCKDFIRSLLDLKGFVTGKAGTS